MIQSGIDLMGEVMTTNVQYYNLHCGCTREVVTRDDPNGTTVIRDGVSRYCTKEHHDAAQRKVNPNVAS